MTEKKKPAKRRGAGAQKQQRKQERIEERRRERAAAAMAARRRARRERFIRWLMIGAAALFAVWFFVFRTQTPGEIRGHEIEKFNVGPANQHTSETVSYPMTPPVGGQHAGSAAACGVHPTKIANENMVHSLEHGAVGLLYDPGNANEEQIRSLEEIVGEYETNVFSAPFPEMETPIAIVSWGEMMRLDTLDEAAVREYVDTFAGKGPEPGQECAKGINQPFEQQTPGAEETPETTVTIPAPEDE